MRAPPGRNSHLEALGSILDPPFGVAFLEGQAGSGSDEVATAWRSVAATRGYLCGSTRVAPLPGDPPLAPLSHALVDALKDFEDREKIFDSLRTIVAPANLDLGPLQRYLRQVEANPSATFPFRWEASELERLASLEAVAAVVQQITRERPLALWFQGVKDASPLLLEHLEVLVRMARQIRLAILFTEDLEERGHPFCERVRELVQNAGARFVQVELGPLDRVFMEEILSQRYARTELPELFKGRVLNTAQGNPGRLLELCARLEGAGLVTQDREGWQIDLTSPWPFPESVEEYRLSAVLDLEEQEYELVEFLSPVGDGIPEGVIQHSKVSSYLGVPERRLRQRLAQLETREVLDREPGGWSFRDPALSRALHQESHAAYGARDVEILAEVLTDLEEVSPLKVATLYEGIGRELAAGEAYRRAAETFEAQGAFLVAGESYRRSRMLLAEAGATPMLEAAIDHYRREGNAWHLATRFPEAEEAYGQALVPAELLDLLPQIAGLRCRRGSIRLRQGLRVSAKDDFEAALGAAAKSGLRKAYRLAALGVMRASRALGEPERVVELYELAATERDSITAWMSLEYLWAVRSSERFDPLLRDLREWAQKDPALGFFEARLLVQASDLLRTMGREDESYQVALEAEPKTQVLGDVEALAQVWEILGSLEIRNPGARATGRWLGLYFLAERIGDRDRQILAGLHAGEGCVDEEYFEMATVVLNGTIQLALDRNLLRNAAHSHNLLGVANLSLNKLYEAQSDFEEAGRLSQEAEDPLSQARSLLGLGRVYQNQRKNTRAREFLAKARDAFMQLGQLDEADQCSQHLEALAG